MFARICNRRPPKKGGLLISVRRKSKKIFRKPPGIGSLLTSKQWMWAPSCEDMHFDIAARNRQACLGLVKVLCCEAARMRCSTWFWIKASRSDLLASVASMTLSQVASCSFANHFDRWEANHLCDTKQLPRLLSHSRRWTCPLRRRNNFTAALSRHVK